MTRIGLSFNLMEYVDYANREIGAATYIIRLNMFYAGIPIIDPGNTSDLEFKVSHGTLSVTTSNQDINVLWKK